MNISYFFAFFLFFVSGVVHASQLSDIHLPAAWATPFAGILLSIAIFPLVAKDFWHRHFGKITFFWTLLYLVPFAFFYGMKFTSALFLHAVIAEYIPFMVLPMVLYVVGGGICYNRLYLVSARSNAFLLTIGGLLASVMGTMGASIVLIRPLLKANKHRESSVHIVIFFILIVANVGGVLTPLGDPPLFLGFLNGIHFFWTVTNLLIPMMTVFCYLLLYFYFFDRYRFKREKIILQHPSEEISQNFQGPIFLGKINFLLLALVIFIVLLSGVYYSLGTIHVFGVPLLFSNILRDISLFIIFFISFWFTPESARLKNDFSWTPVIEIAKLFLGIFITISPVLLMLKEGTGGAFSSLIDLLNEVNGRPIANRYFWITGTLSALLDNSPTYLVFFNMLGGNSQWLMGPGSSLLKAISMGSVFFGSLTYIGNAPNFIVKAIAESYEIKMPSFFSYMFSSVFIMLPVLVAIHLLFL